MDLDLLLLGVAFGGLLYHAMQHVIQQWLSDREAADGAEAEAQQVPAQVKYEPFRTYMVLVTPTPGNTPLIVADASCDYQQDPRFLSTTLHDAMHHGWEVVNTLPHPEGVLWVLAHAPFEEA